MSNQPEVILRYGQGDSEDLTFRIAKEETLIGRAKECDIQLDDPRVSRFHASLRVTTEGIWLLDMESSNGTLIGDQRIPPNRRIALPPDKSFRVGTYTFRAMVGGDSTSTATLPVPEVSPPKMYDLEALRTSEFPHMLDWINLDNAAGAPAPQRTMAKMKQVMDERVATSRWHVGRYPLELLGGFMASAAALINAASPRELVYVEGCSVGLNLFAQSLPLAAGDNIVLCDLEYPANVYPWMSREREGVVVQQIPSVDGGLTLDSLRGAVDDRTRVVTVSAVQFFTGHRTDLAAIGAFCRERDILFVVDAIQAVGHIPIDVRAMNIDALVTGAHKSLMAAPGNGFMYVRDAVCSDLKPRTVGSISTASFLNYLNYDLTPQPGAGRFLIGTPSVEGIAGMVESIGLINELTRPAIEDHTAGLAAKALQMAEARGFELTTKPGKQGPIATFKSKLGRDETAALVQKLDDDKIALARRVDREGNAHLRMSFHCYNTEQELTRAFDALDRMS
jgi:cysteine desulfurase/selenocysteine lyase